MVDPADLAGMTSKTSQGGDIITLDATPLTQLITDKELRILLGDRAAVAAWCHRQLQRPPAERPDDLDTWRVVYSVFIGAELESDIHFALSNRSDGQTRKKKNR